MKNLIILIIFILYGLNVHSQEKVLRFKPGFGNGIFLPRETNFYTNSTKNYADYRSYNSYETYSIPKFIFNSIFNGVQTDFFLEYSLDKRHSIGLGYGNTNDKHRRHIYYYDVPYSGSLGDSFSISEITSTQLQKYTIEYTYNWYYNDIVNIQNNFLNRLKIGTGLGISYGVNKSNIDNYTVLFDTSKTDFINKKTWIIAPKITLSILNKAKTRERLGLSFAYERSINQTTSEKAFVNYYDLNGVLINNLSQSKASINQLKIMLSYPITLYDFNKRKKKKD